VRPVGISGAGLEAQFEELALRHTAKHGFRTYDLLHVASALVLKCDHVLEFLIQKLRNLRRLRGLKNSALNFQAIQTTLASLSLWL